jgi:hypothetical protein
MKQKMVWIMMLVFGVLIGGKSVIAGDDSEVKAKNSKSLQLSGRVQLQHVYSDQFKSDNGITNNGFRMRRLRFQAKGKLNDYVSGDIQFEIRDNNPNLKDGYLKIKLLKNYYLRGGQFKVPVWREEFMRSSGSLLLVERSAPSAVLLLTLLSGRQVGLEFGGDLSTQFSFIFNYSNGSGEGIHELTRRKSFIQNNGKMYSGRLEYNFSDAFKIGISGAVNNLGNKIASADTIIDDTGRNQVIAPDFGIYLNGFNIEGGIGFGKIAQNYAKNILDFNEDADFTIADLTGRWKTKLTTPVEALGGIDAFELAAGISYVNTKEEVSEDRLTYRFGPAVYFGSKTRFQTNIEYVDRTEEDSIFRIRSQFTLNL